MSSLLHRDSRYVVIRLVAHGDFLLLYLPPQLLVSEVDDAGIWLWLLLSENICHMVQESCPAVQQ